MERVVIREQDLTIDVAEASTTDIVYIPGFSTNESLEPFTPTLCSSVVEFNTLIGTEAPVFQSDQYYPGSGSGTTINGMGFKTEAIPSNGANGLSGEQLWFSAGTVDPSYVIAKELIAAGIPVLYEKINDGLSTTTADSDPYYYTISVQDMYRAFIERVFTLDAVETSLYKSNILTKDYDFKYLTSGGYPIFEFGNENTGYQNLTTMISNIAAIRGDCFALIDHTDNPARALIGPTSVFESANTTVLPSNDNQDTFATMFTPYASYSLSNTYANAD